MVRTVITPDKGNISIELPQNYIGKQVEIIAFTIEEATKDTPLTHYASEQSLAKDWLAKEEDDAWKNL
ncbi:MAG: hypothetical protein K0Q79_2563 [Flavipsychrobacter sp.]|jgi:hypothetical protein|nr:hypothetical protein [Flavipsychrobacter sp.]